MATDGRQPGEPVPNEGFSFLPPRRPEHEEGGTEAWWPAMRKGSAGAAGHHLKRRGRALPVRTTFLLEGKTIRLAGNQPLLLDDPEAVWYVNSGAMDLFAVWLEGGQPASARHPVLRAAAGGLVFGFPRAGSAGGPGDLALLASGPAGTELFRLSRALVIDLSRVPATAAELAGLVDGWVGRLSAGIVPDLAPRRFEPLPANGECALPAGAVGRSQEVVWARPIGGEVHYFGSVLTGSRLAEAASPDANGFTPVTRDTWLVAEGEGARLQTRTTSATLADPATLEGLWADLAAFHGRALAWVGERLERERLEAGRRLADRLAADRRQVAGALGDFAAVLDPHARTGLRPTEAGTLGEHEALVRACQLVGEALRVEIRAPPKGEPARDVSDELADIARLSRLRVRRVALESGWWRADAGALLGAWRAGGPVALLPAGGGYLLHDPTGRRLRVTAETADALEPRAVSFYRPLPARALTGLELVRFGGFGSRGDLLTVLATGLASAVLALVVPLATGAVFEVVVPAGDRALLWELGLGLVLVAVTAGLLQFARSVAVLRLEGRLDAAVQAGLWDRLLGLPTAFFRRFPSGVIASSALGVSAIREVLSGVAVSAVLSAVFGLTSLGLLFVLDAGLALVAGGLVLVALAVTLGLGLNQLGRQREIIALEVRLAASSLELIGGVAKFRVAAAEGRAYARWARPFARKRTLDYQARSAQNTLAAFSAAYPLVAQLVVFVAVLTGGGRLSTGGFLAFSAAFAQFLTAVLGLTSAALTVLAVVPYAEGLRPILETAPEVDETKANPGELSGAIEVNNAVFRYAPDGPAILDGLSLRILPGELVAIVGPSGSGKSTLLRLLLGFESLASGAVFFDGQDLATLDLRLVRRQVGVVLQNGKLMPGDILTNIVGSSLHSPDEAWEAARMAGLEDDLKAMPMGIHTVVSEGGANLSGGQRQRLLIARAVLGKPRLLFFDEATSALDNQTQALVTESLTRLQATRVVIAHRLSTIRSADRILVLDGGKLVQEGHYEELANTPGPFQELARRQLA